MLIHMLKFEFLYYNIGEYLEIWVQKLAPYKIGLTIRFT